MKRMKRQTDQRAFTLIEVMVGMAIIGILSAISVPNYVGYRASAQDAAALEEGNNFYHAFMAHYAMDGVATTFSSSSLPRSFKHNTEIDLTGEISVIAGVTAGTMTFTHTNRTTTYTLTGSNGSIQD